MTPRRNVVAIAGGAGVSLLGAALYLRAVLADARPMSLASVLAVVFFSVLLGLCLAGAWWASRRKSPP